MFPPQDEVLDAIDKCKTELRNIKGFYKGKATSIAATQIGFDQIPLFVMCSRSNWSN